MKSKRKRRKPFEFFDEEKNQNEKSSIQWETENWENKLRIGTFGPGFGAEIKFQACEINNVS